MNMMQAAKKWREKMLERKLPILVGFAMLIAACGPQGTPTPSPADVQGTAISAAWTMVAATQQAIPTATPQPPTETPSPTPLPTFTPLPLAIPSLGSGVPTVTQAVSSDPDSCIKVLNVAEAGPTVPIRIENESGGSINISLNLWKKNAFGQCGALSYTVAKNGKIKVNLPKGSWYAYAWVTLPGGKSSTASCSFELRVGDADLLRLRVGKESCKVQA